jgi:hypothetical protein
MIQPFFSESRSNIAFSLSTKDRVELTKEMLPSFLAEGHYDLLWFDGSATEEGRRLAFEVQVTFERLREIHTQVYGGPDAAIVRALTRMIECGYDYCGLIENDVKLQAGWFANLINLFARGKDEGLRIGAVGSRTYQSRVLIPRADFGIMINLGAGMILLTREAAKIVLNGYRTANWYEIFLAALFGAGIALEGQTGRNTSSALTNSATTADWWFDSMLQLHGYCSLAPAPTMAVNIDPQTQAALGADYVRSEFQVAEDQAEQLQRLRTRQAALATAAAGNDQLMAQSKIFLTNPEMGRWIVFPHQALALGGCRLAGGWKLKWSQGWGPFTFVAQDAGSVLEFRCVGDACGLCMMSGPNGGLIEAKAGGLIIARVNLRRDNPEMIVASLQLPHFNDWPIEIARVSEPESAGSEIHWAGLIFSDVQPWFSAKTGFQFSVLEKYL